MNKAELTYNQFKRLAVHQTVVPVYKQILADLLTPVLAWTHLSSSSNYAFLLESVENGNNYSRYSYLGIDPNKIITHSNGLTKEIIDAHTKIIDKPFIELLKNIRNEYNLNKIPELPSFTGGLVGYMGYETISWFEDIPIKEGSDLNIPDSVFMLFEDIIIFDHLKGTVFIVSNTKIDTKISLKYQYEKSKKRIDIIGEKLHSKINYQTPSQSQRNQVNSNLSKSEFHSMVMKAKKYIEQGDIFQVVLSQRFKRTTEANPVTIYRALRTVNPSPYMFHLKLNDFDIIGASPELMVKVVDHEVEVRPIAGTRILGKTHTENQKISQELLSNEKEIAEHLMLVDLGRNDVGKISKYGSVKIVESMEIEKYSHVMHIVSSVKGELDTKFDSLDALISGFPAGTVTGAPKIRAMQIINELEIDRRDIYSGFVGFFDFSGNVNTCIAIRTMVVKNNTVFFQSGAGIVYDSKPDAEYEETINKAKAIMSAIDFAENGLV